MVLIPTPPYPELPPAVRQAEDLGRAALQKQSQHHLDKGYRYAIVDAFAPRPIRVLTMSCLDLVVADKVVTLWNEAFPGDESPKRWLGIVDRALAGQVSQQEAEYVGEVAHFYIKNLTHAPPQAFAAASAACVAETGAIILTLDELVLDSQTIANRYAASTLTERPNEPDWQRSDAEDEYDTHDASFWASAAVAGGAPWDAGSDSQKRAEFWEWWLDEAVPAAYAIVYPYIPEPMRS